jgi:hypothetical protein
MVGAKMSRGWPLLTQRWHRVEPGPSRSASTGTDGEPSWRSETPLKSRATHCMYVCPRQTPSNTARQLVSESCQSANSIRRARLSSDCTHTH